AGRGLDDPELPATLDAIPQGTPAAVKISATIGPLYHVGKITVRGDVPETDRRALNLNSGDPAIAAAVLGAQARLLAALQEDGYALAKMSDPQASANDTTHTIDIVYPVDKGPQLDIGNITFNGLKDINPAFAQRALGIHPGQRYRTSRIEAARQALAGLGVFSGVSVHAAEHPDVDGRLPLTFDVEERKQHAVTLAGAYSTDLGISLSATWSHRNLFGNAEQLNLTVAGSGLGNSTRGLGYNLAAQYIQPLFQTAGQTLEFDLAAIKQQLDAYDQTAETLAGFVRRKFSALWTGSAGLSLTQDDVVQEGTQTLYQLVALPITVTYDSTGIADALLDATTGLRTSAAVTPTHAFGGSDPSFLVMQVSAASYFDVSGDGRSVIALRGLVGSIVGGSNLEVPPDQRLYAGGSGTVRGYAYQSIGPQFPDSKPVGVKSVDAATVEFRQRIGEHWGAAAFLDAGQAGTETPFTGALHTGAGVGARYYTPIGAVRVDVAVPLRRERGGDAFEFYIGLGQAF
ncbi:MAG TPA: BamA/TamA family outer membrane protein, partial [Rhizomicrobium sp.]|nr:BamA/TamA family outer membrane protein [Rhizomicrobium sp.]